jgi:hypothetical protein
MREELHEGILGLLEGSATSKNAGVDCTTTLQEALKILSCNHYRALRLQSSADSRELKRSYRRQILLYHPDKNAFAAPLFICIQTAYEVLNNPKKRAIYDVHESRRKRQFRQQQEQWRQQLAKQSQQPRSSAKTTKAAYTFQLSGKCLSETNNGSSFFSTIVLEWAPADAQDDSGTQWPPATDDWWFELSWRVCGLSLQTVRTGDWQLEKRRIHEMTCRCTLKPACYDFRVRVWVGGDAGLFSSEVRIDAAAAARAEMKAAAEKMERPSRAAAAAMGKARECRDRESRAEMGSGEMKAEGKEEAEDKAEQRAEQKTEQKAEEKDEEKAQEKWGDTSDGKTEADLDTEVGHELEDWFNSFWQEDQRAWSELLQRREAAAARGWAAAGLGSKFQGKQGSGSGGGGGGGGIGGGGGGGGIGGSSGSEGGRSCSNDSGSSSSGSSSSGGAENGGFHLPEMSVEQETNWIDEWTEEEDRQAWAEVELAQKEAVIRAGLSPRSAEVREAAFQQGFGGGGGAGIGAGGHAGAGGSDAAPMQVARGMPLVGTPVCAPMAAVPVATAVPASVHHAQMAVPATVHHAQMAVPASMHPTHDGLMDINMVREQEAQLQMWSEQRARERQAGAGVEDWSCRHCTLNNAAAHLVCSACGIEKPDPAGGAQFSPMMVPVDEWQAEQAWEYEHHQQRQPRRRSKQSSSGVCALS